MKKLMAVVVVAVCAMWSTAAFADYASLGEDGQLGPYIGIGGIMLSGDDATGASGSEFLPTVNISGVNDMWWWQAFYGFDSDTSVFGGTLDYIVADNFDECDTCEGEEGLWWFGVGATFASYSDLFEDATGAVGVTDTDFGPNLGLGWAWDEWSFQVMGHYLMANQVLGGQVSINYAFD
jgi:hypothetical protein